jgi:hypothetical protein
MQRTLLALTAAIAFLPAALRAQQPEDTLHVRDGGTRESMTSIDVVPAANAPFSAVVVTDWTRLMPDGSRATMKNHRLIARDSSGRVFQERRYLTPKGDTETTQLSELDFIDPNRHERQICRPALHVCYLTPYNRPVTVALPPAGPLPNDRGKVTREALGQKTIEDVDVVGSREITTLNSGVIGNEKPQPIVKEFWFSPRLSLNVVTKRFDPIASAVQDINVTQINLSEPDPKLFEPPAGYRVIRMDTPQTAAVR